MVGSAAGTLPRIRVWPLGLILLKQTGEFIGQAGLSMQDCDGEQLLEIATCSGAYIGTRGTRPKQARALKQYAFDTLGAQRVYSIIRDTNIASQKVAMRNDMLPVKQFVKHYYGMDMPHIVFCGAARRMNHTGYLAKNAERPGHCRLPAFFLWPSACYLS